jgi:hypothetical protein
LFGHLLQRCDLALYVLQLAFRHSHDSLQFSSVSGYRFSAERRVKRQQFAHLVRREAEPLAPFDEQQMLQILLLVAAATAGRTPFLKFTSFCPADATVLKFRLGTL